MKGEIVFDALGARWTAFFGNAAQCGLEEHFDKGFFAIVADALPGISVEDLERPDVLIAKARGVRLSTLRDLFWFALRKHHPSVTLDEVSAIADDVGQAAFGDILGRAIAATQDTKAAAEAGGAAPGKLRTRGRKQTG